MRKLLWPLIIILVLAVTYLLGPTVETPQLDRKLPHFTMSTSEAEDSIAQAEGGISTIKPDNEARIIWFDSTKNRTPYSIVYLHGWSASQAEGSPIHRELAKRYGCNLFLARLAGHGLNEEEPMLELTAHKLVESAKQAIAVGKVIGEKVIVLATSNGATLGLYLAAGNEEDIEALLLYSPNVNLYDQTSILLNNPWGLQIARLVQGGKYFEWELDSAREKYWTSKYRLEALTQLRELVDETMTEETFYKVSQPTFLGYYYKNDTAQDEVVSVPAMLTMFRQLGTPEELKRKVAFPEAGHHVIGSSMTSKDLESVRAETFKFVEEVIGLAPVAQ